MSPHPARLPSLATPLALLALLAFATSIQQFAHAQDTAPVISLGKEDSASDTKREAQARALVRTKKLDDLEAHIASTKSTEAPRTPVERDAAVAIDLMILAQEARNDARFDDAVALSARALARMDNAERQTPAADLDRKVYFAEFRAQLAEVYGPDAGFRAKAQSDLAEKRAQQALRKAAKKEAAQ